MDYSKKGQLAAQGLLVKSEIDPMIEKLQGYQAQIMSQPQKSSETEGYEGKIMPQPQESSEREGYQAKIISQAEESSHREQSSSDFRLRSTKGSKFFIIIILSWYISANVIFSIV